MSIKALPPTLHLLGDITLYTEIMVAVKVENLTISFGDTLGLDSVSFTASKGEVVALLGPNGAGKTTIVNALIGHVKPLSGTVEIFGLNPLKNRKELCTRWAVMPQKGGLPAGLTVKETIDLFSRLHTSLERSDQIIEAVGLKKFSKRRWKDLSSGEQQKLNLAVALAGGHDLLLLDEPTAGLDISSRLNLLELISQRAKEGATVLITTHIYGDAENIADKVLVLKEGQLVNTSKIADIRQSQPQISFSTKPGLPIAAVAEELHKWGQEVSPGHYVIQGKADKDTLAILTSWLTFHNAELKNLKVGNKSLKEFIFEITADQDMES